MARYASAQDNAAGWWMVAARAFYEDILGLPLVNFMSSDEGPQHRREKNPMRTCSSRMADNSYVAFFDLGENAMPEPSPNTPSWVQHLAPEVPTVGDVVRMKERLDLAGVETKGVVDHEFIKSVYFFDPNGLRLEVTARTEAAGYIEEAARSAHGQIKEWSSAKRLTHSSLRTGHPGKGSRSRFSSGGPRS